MRHTILIVEDYDSLRQLLGTYLSNYYGVLGAKNGVEAMGLLHRGVVPDAVITDLQMPDLNGMEFITHLRDSGLYRNIPLIVITGEKSEETERRCRHLGIHAFIEKPFNPIILQQQLDQLFKTPKQLSVTAV